MSPFEFQETSKLHYFYYLADQLLPLCTLFSSLSTAPLLLLSEGNLEMQLFSNCWLGHVLSDLRSQLLDVTPLSTKKSFFSPFDQTHVKQCFSLRTLKPCSHQKPKLYLTWQMKSRCARRSSFSPCDILFFQSTMVPAITTAAHYQQQKRL